MSWKDISKSSYTIESGKFTLPRPANPFALDLQGQKIFYSEGDEITSIADYRFNLDFTGVPYSPEHDPCGYWHKNYVPPFTVIYTSRPYPIEFQDNFKSLYVDIIAGDFRDIYIRYDTYSENFKCDTNSLVYGTLDIKNHRYIYSENFNHTIISIFSGVFKKSLWRHEYAEVFNHVNIAIYSGNFRDALIKYSWPVEEFTHTSITLISGTHS